MAGEKPVGRPTLYTEELAGAILERLSNGETLASICRDDAMPANSTVRLWTVKNADFSAQYARAFEAGAEARLQEMYEIADGMDSDSDPNKVRIQIDVRKFDLARNPRFSGRIKHEHSGPDGGPIRTELGDAERIARLGSLAAQIGALQARQHPDADGDVDPAAGPAAGGDAESGGRGAVRGRGRRGKD